MPQTNANNEMFEGVSPPLSGYLLLLDTELAPCTSTKELVLGNKYTTAQCKGNEDLCNILRANKLQEVIQYLYRHI